MVGEVEWCDNNQEAGWRPRAVRLVEIDLLRGSEHTTAAAPRWRIERKAGLFHDHVSLHRFDKSLGCVLSPIPLPARLPKLPIPLLPGDGEVIIDLQAAVDRCYDTSLYSRRVEVPAGPPDAVAGLRVSGMGRERPFEASKRLNTP